MPNGCNKLVKFSLINKLIDQTITQDVKLLPSFVDFDSVSGRIILFGKNMREGQKLYTFVL